MTAGGGRLHDRHLADLKGSGQSDATISAAHAHTLTDPAEVAGRLNWKGAADCLGPCLCLPYLDLEGKPNGYAVLKPDRPRADRKRPGRTHEYELPAGGGNRLYIPPGVGPRLSDPAAPLVLTEGVKKALKATQDGFPTLGLSGVWNWTVKGVRRLIADLSAVAWKGRRVYVVFDSDAAHNESVARAERELTELLRSHGAVARVVRLPWTGRSSTTSCGMLPKTGGG
jgi:hypothetical protein